MRERLWGQEGTVALQVLGEAGVVFILWPLLIGRSRFEQADQRRFVDQLQQLRDRPRVPSYRSITGMPVILVRAGAAQLPAGP